MSNATGTPAGVRIETPRYRFFDAAMPDGDWLKFAEWRQDAEPWQFFYERPLNAVELAAASMIRQHVRRDRALGACQDVMQALENENHGDYYHGPQPAEPTQ